MIGDGADVGPFAYLRPGTVLGAGGKIGTYVETKNARIGDGAKVPHLSYVGDAEIGEGTNIGAGTIFANYDGVAKHRTTVGEHAGPAPTTSSSLPSRSATGRSPVAGTVVRRDVPPGALAVSAGPQRNLEGWVLEPRAGTPRPGGRGRRRDRARDVSRDAAQSRVHGGPGAQSNVAPNRGDSCGERNEADHREEPDGLLRPRPPRARRGGRRAARHRPGPDVGVRVRQRRDLRPLRGVGARLRRLRDPEPHRADQRVDHGAPDHGRRAEAGVGQADHGRDAVLRLRPAGQEAPRP